MLLLMCKPDLLLFSSTQVGPSYSKSKTFWWPKRAGRPIPLASDTVCLPHRLFGPTQLQTVKVSYLLIVMGHPRSRREISGQIGAFGSCNTLRPTPAFSQSHCDTHQSLSVELSLLTQKADRKILSHKVPNSSNQWQAQGHLLVPLLQYPVGLIPEAAAGRKHKPVGVAEGGRFSWKKRMRGGGSYFKLTTSVSRDFVQETQETGIFENSCSSLLNRQLVRWWRMETRPNT